ncbi:MAG TPA: hypothetical protein VFF16_13410 [Telluria sp.]|nr:hypothetical protein [Telluria sp.]
MNAHSNRHDDPLVRIELDLQELRARFDTALPHLATKEDIKEGVNRALRWIVGTLAGCFVLFLAIMGLQHEEVLALRADMRADTKELRGEIATVRTDLHQEIREVRQEMDAMRQDMRRMNDTLERIEARQLEAERWDRRRR